jgi:hypothetical protein
VRRREFLVWTLAGCGVRLQADRSTVWLAPDASSAADVWRTFEITTHVHVQNASGTTRVWLPTPLAVAPYQTTAGDTYEIDGGSVLMIERDGLDVLAAEWPDGHDPILRLTSRASTRAHVVDFAAPTVPPPRDFSAFSGDLRPLKAPPLDDAAIKAMAADAARGAGTDLDRARAIFDLVVSRTSDSQAFDPHARLTALLRAAGIPARPVYGLGVAQADATNAQHDRVEVYLVGYGWTPIDVRDRRFGSWDMRWVAFNSMQDVVLPGSTTGAVRHFMHPQGETGQRRIDSLNAEAFRYSITVREEG